MTKNVYQAVITSFGPMESNGYNYEVDVEFDLWREGVAILPRIAGRQLYRLGEDEPIGTASLTLTLPWQDAMELAKHQNVKFRLTLEALSNPDSPPQPPLR